MRLDKFLADMQLGTRSQVKEDIRKGNIMVNQEIIKDPGYQIHEETDVVALHGEVLSFQRFQYYMLHKPAGFITATKDAHDKTVMELLSGASGKNLSPVGRLDKDTEGLLLITNDGELSHNLLAPKKHVAKTYYVECQGYISENSLNRLRTGVDIGDTELTKPAEVSLVSSNNDTFVIKLTITEGRFHQVKRMIHAIGSEVTYLKRLSMGSLVLDEKLPKGAFRSLTNEEITALKKGRN